MFEFARPLMLMALLGPTNVYRFLDVFSGNKHTMSNILPRLSIQAGVHWQHQIVEGVFERGLGEPVADALLGGFEEAIR